MQHLCTPELKQGRSISKAVRRRVSTNRLPSVTRTATLPGAEALDVSFTAGYGIYEGARRQKSAPRNSALPPDSPSAFSGAVAYRRFGQ